MLPPATQSNSSPQPVPATEEKLWRYIDELAERQEGRRKPEKGAVVGLESPEVQAVLELLDLRLWDVWVRNDD